MVKPKKEKTKIEEEVTQQFERSIIKELSKKKDIEGIKKYIKKYFSNVTTLMLHSFTIL